MLGIRHRLVSLRQGVKAKFRFSRYYPVTRCGQQEVLGFRQCNFASFRNSGAQLCGSEVGLELTCGLGSFVCQEVSVQVNWNLGYRQQIVTSKTHSIYMLIWDYNIIEHYS